MWLLLLQMDAASCDKSSWSNPDLKTPNDQIFNIIMDYGLECHQQVCLARKFHLHAFTSYVKGDESTQLWHVWGYIFLYCWWNWSWSYSHDTYLFVDLWSARSSLESVARSLCAYLKSISSRVHWWACWCSVFFWHLANNGWIDGIFWYS